MKNNLFLLIFLLTLFKSSLAQTDTLKLKQFGDSTEFSELNLNPDKTFAFHYYNRISCYMWHSVYGTWKIKNNKIVFTDKISIPIVDNPGADHIIRTTTYRIDGNEIYFECHTYTNGKGYGERNWGNFRTIAGRITPITMNQ